jgi:predicted flap endonuclease-1-like 5' DNA nuclease
MLEAGICSTSRIASAWGLTGKPVKQADRVQAAEPAVASAKGSPMPKPRARPAATPPRASGVGAVIEDALRAAGLMR